MIKHIIWDLDGTLINSEPEIIMHLTNAVNSVGVDESKKKAEFRIGPTLDKVIRGAYDDVNDEDLAAIIKNFRNSYDNCGFVGTFPFEGVEDLLDEHDDIKHHIVTNKPQFATEQVINKLQWKDRFSSIRSPYIVDGAYIPKSQMMSDLINEFNIDSSEVISVGDMSTDAIAANANNVYSIGVTWGTGHKEELDSVCKQVVSTIKELNILLKNFNSNS